MTPALKPCVSCGAVVCKVTRNHQRCPACVKAHRRAYHRAYRAVRLANQAYRARIARNAA